MSQEFIKQPNLPVTKSMPSLMGINLNGLQKQTGYGDIIAKGLQYTNALVEKADTIKQNNELTNLKQKFDDMENEFAFQYLSDPNVYNTDEGRKKFMDAYNNLIEQKKTILQDSNVELSKDNRDKLIGYFKNTTWNNLFKFQQGMNQGYLKEQTDNVLLSSEKSIMLLPTYTDPLQQENAVAEQLQNIKALERLGINTDKMQLQYLTKSQEAITDKKIDIDIINNNNNPEFYKTEKVGNKIIVVTDSEGNPVIDVNKKIKALYNLGDTFLSDKECMESAKTLHEQTGIDLDTAYAYIRGARKEKWLKSSYTANAKLLQQSAIEEEKTRLYEQRVTDAMSKANTEMQTAIDTNDIPKMLTLLDAKNIGLDTAVALGGININTGKSYAEQIYGDNVQNIYNNKQYIPMLNSNQLKNFDFSYQPDGSINIGEAQGFANMFKYYVSNKDGKLYPSYYIDFTAQQLAKNSNNDLLKNPQFMKAFVGFGNQNLPNQETMYELITATNKHKNFDVNNNFKGEFLGKDHSLLVNQIVGAYCLENMSTLKLSLGNKPSLRAIENALQNASPDTQIKIKTLITQLENGFNAPVLTERLPENTMLLKEQAINKAKTEEVNKWAYQIKDDSLKKELDKDANTNATKPQFTDSQKGIFLTIDRMDNNTFINNYIFNNETMLKYQNLSEEINRRNFSENELQLIMKKTPIGRIDILEILENKKSQIKN